MPRALRVTVAKEEEKYAEIRPENDARLQVGMLPMPRALKVSRCAKEEEKYAEIRPENDARLPAVQVQALYMDDSQEGICTNLFTLRIFVLGVVKQTATLTACRSYLGAPSENGRQRYRAESSAGDSLQGRVDSADKLTHVKDALSAARAASKHESEAGAVILVQKGKGIPTGKWRMWLRWRHLTLVGCADPGYPC